MRTPHHGSTNDKTYKDKISNTDNICQMIQNKNIQNKDTTPNSKKISNTDPIEKSGVDSGAPEGYAVPTSNKHPPCCSYTYSCPITVLSAIEERRNLRKMEKIHCHMRYGYIFRNG